MADADICLLFGAHRDRRAEFKHDGVRHFVVTAFVDGKKFFEKRQAFLDARSTVGCEGLFRCRDRKVYIGSRTHRDNRNGLFGGGVMISRSFGSSGLIQ